MSKSTPLISVNMVTYNHQHFIAAAIRSVLAQTFPDFELVVMDDGSTDRTGEVVRSFADPRIRYLHQKNQGPSVAANNGIASCIGKYLALMSGDDICHPTRLERQLAEYRSGGSRVLFSRVDFIDDQGAPLTGSHFAAGIFDAPNLPRSGVLERFFNVGNYLNGVTVFTEWALFQSERPYNELLLYLQDFEKWIRLAKRYNIWIMPDKLLSYRVRGDQGNLSFPSRQSHIAALNEQYVILTRFFEDIPIAMFKEAFAGQLIHPDFKDGPEYLCEQAFAYLRSAVPVARLIGLEKINGLWHGNETGTVLRVRYHFTASEYFKHMRTFNYLDPSAYAASADDGGGTVNHSAGAQSGTRGEKSTGGPARGWLKHLRRLAHLVRKGNWTHSEGKRS